MFAGVNLIIAVRIVWC